MPVFSAATSRVSGNSENSNEYIFALENGRNSLVDVTLIRGVFQVDRGSVALTTVMPLVTGYAASSIGQSSGASLIPKALFQTGQTSDSYVKVWSAYSPDAWDSYPLDATESGGGLNTGYGPRLHDLTGQVLSDDGELLPEISSGQIVLHPGESIVWKVSVTSALTNPLVADWFFQCVWSESAATTYTISGTATNSGVAVSGAKITVLVADDTSLTNAFLLGVYTTNGSGAWSASVPNGKVAYAYGQNFSGGTYYTAPGAPYIT